MATKPTKKPVEKAASATTKAKVSKPSAAAKATDTKKPVAAKKAPAKAATASPAKKAAVSKSPYDAKPWLASYPAGVPADIAPLKYNSVAELLESSCRKYGDKPAFTCMGKTINYTQLHQQSSVIGAWLTAHGLKKGDRVAIMMPNILQFPVVMMGILRAGCTVVNVNPLYTPRELEHQLKDSGAKAIFILENFAHTLQQVYAKTDLKHVVVTSMGDQMGGLKGAIVNLVVRRVKKMVPSWSLPSYTSYKSLISGNGGSFATVQTGHDDLAFLQYTGGTTGVSKGAALSNANVLSNAEQNSLWVEVAYRAKGRPENLTYVCALPLYHIFALVINAIMGMEQGGHNVLIPNPRDIPGFIKELGKWDFNIVPGLNTLFNGMMNNEDFAKLNFKHLLLTLGGGMAVQRPVAERWQKITGCNIHEGYGLSETSPVATSNPFDQTEFSGIIGVPIPGTSIAIRDDDGKNLPLGEVGEICIKGPQVMTGYWNRPDETAKVMTNDGYFKSGDMGFMDEKGFTKIVDRKKDMILVSGFNVYPNEVEEVAASHEGIIEAAAVAVPDENSGEAVKLFVVLKDKSLTEQDVKDWCATSLTNYKRPKYIVFKDELPKTNVGKILRRELRD